MAGYRDSLNSSPDRCQLQVRCFIALPICTCWLICCRLLTYSDACTGLLVKAETCSS